MNMTPIKMGLNHTDVLWVMVRPWMWPIVTMVVTMAVVDAAWDRLR